MDIRTKKYGAIPSMKVVLFLMGVLNANQVITQNELDSMSKKFTYEIIKTNF